MKEMVFPVVEEIDNLRIFLHELDVFGTEPVTTISLESHSLLVKGHYNFILYKDTKVSIFTVIPLLGFPKYRYLQ